MKKKRKKNYADERMAKNGNRINREKLKYFIDIYLDLISRMNGSKV
jgi:hypothetical protein